MCTDGSAEEKETLRQNLAPVAVHFLEEDLGANFLLAGAMSSGRMHEPGPTRAVLLNFRAGHPGVNAITEQWIAARANRFIGTAESRYVVRLL